MHTLDEIVTESPVFAGLDPDQLQVIVGCAQNAAFFAGERLFREGEAADTFYLVRRGRVALTTHVPGRGEVTIDTVDPGEVLGWSWLFPPYTWHFDARAVEDTGVVAFDGACLRGKCDADHALGFELLRRFAQVVIDRLQNTRTLLLDVYGHSSDS